jgi:hypothetical protein
VTDGVPVTLDPIALRRAALYAALREGDIAAAARAWSRLRVTGASIDAPELAAAHALRGEMGRAIRVARERRSDDANVTPVARTEVVPLPRASPWALRVALAVIALAALALALLPAIARISSVVAPAPLSAVVTPAPATAGASSLSGGRGRIEVKLPLRAVSTPAAVAAPAVAATSAPTASTSLAPTPSPSATPAPSATPQPLPAPVALPTALPPVSTPTAALFPPPLASGFSRIRVLVVDATTLVPIPGACIVIGAPDCGPLRPHTNALGLWWVDFPTGSIAGSRFPVTIQKDGYQAVSVVVTTTGMDQDFPAPLTPIP